MDYHDISLLCLIYDFERRNRKELYKYFFNERNNILENFKKQKKKINIENELDKLIIYKK